MLWNRYYYYQRYCTNLEVVPMTWKRLTSILPIQQQHRSFPISSSSSICWNHQCHHHSTLYHNVNSRMTIMLLCGMVVVVGGGSGYCCMTYHWWNRNSYGNNDDNKNTINNNNSSLHHDKTISKQQQHDSSNTNILTLYPIATSSSSVSKQQQYYHHPNSNHTTTKQTPLHSPRNTIRMIRPNPYMEICYDTRTRNAIYVQHQIVVDLDVSSDINHNTHHNDTSSSEQSLGTTTSKPIEQQSISSPRTKRYHFYEDTSIEESFRSRNSYYHLSGYDRGHLIPAGDFTQHYQQQYHDDDGNDDSSSSNNNINYVKDTYNLCNISPQHSELNRKQWSNLEQWVRSIAKQYYEQNRYITYVTTGPIYIPQQQIHDKLFQYHIYGIGIPPYMIMVPTHFFKVIVVVHPMTHEIQSFACFVLPNHAEENNDDDNDDGINENKSLQDYLVRWTDLEAVTGLVFYPDIISNDDTFKRYADHLTETLLSDNISRRRQKQQKEIQQQNSLIPSNYKDFELMVSINNNNNNSHTKQQQLKYNTSIQQNDISRNNKNRSSWDMKHVQHIQHLCNNQACISRKQLQQQKQRSRM